MNLGAIRDRVAVDTVRLAPKLLFSSAVGWGARKTLPASLRRPFYTAFARAVGVQLDEVELPLEEYPSFGSFFARRLRSGARPIAEDGRAVISPCDGALGPSGEIRDGTLIQAKGRAYRLRDLLADDDLAEAFQGGSYVTIYLSPRDYHRVHAPIASELLGYTFVPGTLYPVSPYFTERIEGIFATNERVIFDMRGGAGRMALIMVGASGVGNMSLTHPCLETRRLRGSAGPRTVRFREPIAVERGTELGAFHLGSTVLVLFERDRVTLASREKGAGPTVRFGERLAVVEEDDRAKHP